MNKWDRKDWKWLTGILIGIIIISFSLWLVEYSINFGIISSSVSIALALVAIYMSLQQNRDNHDTKMMVNQMKYEVINHVKDVGVKVDNIPTDITPFMKQLQEFSNTESSGEIQMDTSNIVKDKKSLYNAFLDVNTFEKKSVTYKYQLNVEVSNLMQLEILVAKISQYFKGKNIFYNHVGFQEYEIVFLSELGDLEKDIDSIGLEADIPAIKVLGIHHIG